MQKLIYTTFFFLLASVWSTAIYSADLNIIVDMSTEMPMANIKADHLIGGIHYEFGKVLAKELGREAHFILLPRKRISPAIAKGQGDLSCHYLPEWLPGDFDWTIPFMPNKVLLVSDLHVPAPVNIAALSNKPIGTILGFSYPTVEKILGQSFVREVAPNATLNLKKLTNDRMHYALVGGVFLTYQQKIGQFTKPLHRPIVVKEYEAQCVVSKNGQVKVADINKAIEKIKKSKQLKAIYDHYL